MLFTGLGSASIVKKCDLQLENTTLGLWPRVAFTIFHYTNFPASK